MVSRGVGAAFAFSLGVLGCLNQHRVVDLVDLLRARCGRWQKVGVVGEVGMVALWEAGAGRGRRGRWGVLRWRRRRWRWRLGEMGDTGEEGDERYDLGWHLWKRMKRQWNPNGCAVTRRSHMLFRPSERVVFHGNGEFVGRLEGVLHPAA